MFQQVGKPFVINKTEKYFFCRILPPVFRNERLCTKDWEYKGLKIKKGKERNHTVYTCARQDKDEGLY
jgi:hypothetical protein